MLNFFFYLSSTENPINVQYPYEITTSRSAISFLLEESSHHMQINRSKQVREGVVK